MGEERRGSTDALHFAPGEKKGGDVVSDI